MRPHLLFHHFGIIVFLISATTYSQDDLSKTKSIDFQRVVLPILQERCIECHNESLQMADLRLDTREAMIDSRVLQPGTADKSLLVRRLNERELGILMPPTGSLSKSETESLKAWINDGAQWPAGLTLEAASSGKAIVDRVKTLFTVIRNDDLNAVREILADKTLIESENQHGSTPLMHAALYASTDCVELLLNLGADVNATDENGMTALMFAVAELTKVRLLIDRGSNVTKQSKLGRNALLLASAYASYSDCLIAENVAVLLDRGAEPTAKDKRGETSLSLAKQRGPTEILRLLELAAKVKSDIKTDAESAPNRTAIKTEPVANVPSPEDRGTRDLDLNKIRQLAQKSVAMLQSCGPQFYAKSGCVACHQQTATSLAVSMASKKGLTVDDQIERQQVKLTAVDLGLKRVAWLQRIKVGGTTHRMGYLLWGLSEAIYTPDEFTDAAYFELAGLQLANGSWVSDAHRPPTEYSPVTATAVSMRGLQCFAPPGHKANSQQRVKNATRWLVNTRASANAEKSFRLLGLRWGDADLDDIAAATEELLQEQNENGGWSQLPALESDAYATGLTLVALHQGGGLSMMDPRYREGVKFLLDTSREDGTWHVKSRSYAFQPYFESGFPFEHDQWISAAASGWASMALLQMIDEHELR
ncbi:MAG TPA: ankyrin repeat domain-containing protein [Pirellula sp.]|nr:ankyrin repeat domain-containing protein [Pirellula sp.]